MERRKTITTIIGGRRALGIKVLKAAQIPSNFKWRDIQLRGSDMSDSLYIQMRRYLIDMLRYVSDP